MKRVVNRCKPLTPPPPPSFCNDMDDLQEFRNEAVAACGDETWRHLNEPCGQSCQDYIQNNQSRMRQCMTYAEANGATLGPMRSWITRCQ